MSKFANKDLAELSHQLTISPKRQRLSQIMGIESLLSLIDKKRTYPYDMVCHAITGYRNRRELVKGPIAGDKLVGDLVLMAEQITRKTAIATTEIEDCFYTYDDVAEKLEVSTKTIRRWRRRGLMGFRAVFEDGVSRLVYLKATVDRFVAANKSLVRRGAAFKQLTEEEKDGIVEAARSLLSERRLRLHVIARELAENTGRAVETIRYTLRRYDEAHPETALFVEGGIPAAPERHRRIWDAHRSGTSVQEIASQLGASVDNVQQVVREMAARTYKAEPTAYVYNELFDAPNADKLILDVPRPAASNEPRKARAPRDLPAYLRSLYQIPLLTPEQELDAFRRYNYLKFKAAKLIASLDVCRVTQGQLDAVAALVGAYESLRKEIVQANLRLVVSIAKRHVGWSPRFFEVISDGNMSLLRAIERFDFGRGFKFSTYASWAIMKNFARTIPEEHYHGGRFVTGQSELLEAAADHRSEADSLMDRRALTDTLKTGMENLTERERTIVTAHFGLFGRGDSATLEELGSLFGVTKERVRQIERRAMSKIRQAISPVAAEFLPE